MATNIELNAELVAEAMEIGGHKTKKAAVNDALMEYVQRRKRLELLELRGQIEYYPDYDYKALRSRKRGDIDDPDNQ